MERTEIRLRIFEKLHRHDYTADNLLLNFKIFEKYVLGDEDEKKPEQKNDKKKKGDNLKEDLFQ